MVICYAGFFFKLDSRVYSLSMCLFWPWRQRKALTPYVGQYLCACSDFEYVHGEEEKIKPIANPDIAYILLLQ